MIRSLCQRTRASVRQICEVLQWPRSSFYKTAGADARQASGRQVGDLVEKIFHRHKGRYGYRRIHCEMADRAVVCAPQRVRRIMLQKGLRAIQPRRFAPQTSDGRASRPSPNLLLNEPLPSQMNRVWAGDITYIPTASGWLYLAVVIDLYSRRIVGWKLADHLRAPLVAGALENALQSRQVSDGLIFHSDRGSQYGSSVFRALLKRAQMRQSMSARANPYDNAWTESFMGTLKLELVQKQRDKDAGEARLNLFEYIEAYYNTQRKHSSIGYLSPSQFERSC